MNAARRSARLLVGLVVTAAGLYAPWLLLNGRFAEAGAGAPTPLESVRQYLLAPRREVRLRFSPAVQVAVGDAIFHETAPGVFEQVGEVRVLVDAEAHPLAARQGLASAATASLYPSAPPLTVDSQLDYYVTPGSLAWVVETLLPRDRQERLVEHMRKTLAAHQNEIVAAARPVVEAALVDAVAIVHEDLDAALARHARELEALAARYQKEVVERELAPLLGEEVMPIIRQRAQPLLSSVGRELWERLSLWRFGWRFVYDRSPLPDQSLTEQEWDRFVKEDAMPVLATHTQEFVEVLRQISDDVANNERVRKTLAATFERVLTDPELRRVTRQILDEAILRNRRLWNSLEEHFHGDAARQAFELASARLEPTLRQMADEVLGTRESGVSPEFAHVLRNQILLKDQRWFVLRGGSAERAAPASGAVESLAVRPGVVDADTNYPFRGARHVDGS